MFKDRILDGQVVLITGGGTGLGAAMGERFAELGAKLALVSRSLDHLEPEAEKLRAKGYQVAVAAADVRNFDAIEAAVDRFSKELGPINVLVNNAAGNFLSPTEKLSARAFAAVVEIVLEGTFPYAAGYLAHYSVIGPSGKAEGVYRFQFTGDSSRSQFDPKGRS